MTLLKLTHAYQTQSEEFCTILHKGLRRSGFFEAAPGAQQAHTLKCKNSGRVGGCGSSRRFKLCNYMSNYWCECRPCETFWPYIRRVLQTRNRHLSLAKETGKKLEEKRCWLVRRHRGGTRKIKSNLHRCQGRHSGEGSMINNHIIPHSLKFTIHNQRQPMQPTEQR